MDTATESLLMNLWHFVFISTPLATMREGSMSRLAFHHNVHGSESRASLVDVNLDSHKQLHPIETLTLNNPIVDVSTVPET